MDAINIINELLYIISTYEKGKICCGKSWRRKARKLFLESLYVMELLVDLLTGNLEQTTEQILYIQNFMVKNTNIIFPENENLCNNIADLLLVDSGVDVNSSNQRDVIALMKFIIRKCKTERKAKINFYLLMAFHNLPRTFFKSNLTPLFKFPVNPITTQEALSMAELWIKKQK